MHWIIPSVIYQCVEQRSFSLSILTRIRNNHKPNKRCMMKKTLSILAVVMLTVPLAWAQGGGMMGGMMGSGMMGDMMSPRQNMHPSMGGCMQQGTVQKFMDMGLSDAQIGKIIDAQANLAKKQAPLLRRQQELTKTVNELQTADKTDYRALKSALSDLGTVNADLAVNAAEARESASTGLNDEQKEKITGMDLSLFSGSAGGGCGAISGGMMSQGGDDSHADHHGTAASGPNMAAKGSCCNKK